MTVLPGSKIGPYDIAAQIGAGGMGEVYRARDSRLGRDVAIKVLPASFSADPDRLHRFAQEARAAAARPTAIELVGLREGAQGLECREGAGVREFELRDFGRSGLEFFREGFQRGDVLFLVVAEQVFRGRDGAVLVRACAVAEIEDAFAQEDRAALGVAW